MIVRKWGQGGQRPLRTFQRIRPFWWREKKSKKLYFNQWVCVRAVFEPNMQNHPSKQQQDAISYLLESKVAQYSIQKYHQPSEMLIASPHILPTLPILLSLLTLLILLTLLALLKLPILPKTGVHWQLGFSGQDTRKSTCGANRTCIVNHHLRQFLVF